MISKPKHAQNEILEEVNLNSKEKHSKKVKISGSQIDNKQRESKVDTKVNDKKCVPKEKTPDKNIPCKEQKREKTILSSPSKSEKSSKPGHQEKLKNVHSLSTEKKSKSSTKDDGKSSGSNRLKSKITVHETVIRERDNIQAENTFSGEEFETPTMSFESYLNYDQASNKRKKKSYPINEPPRKVEKVCKQYYNLEISKAEHQSPIKEEEEVEHIEASICKVKKGCLEDLLNVPLPKILADYSIFSSPPHPSEYKEYIPESLPEMKPESCEFTGRRLNSKMLVYSGSKILYLPKMLSLYEQCIRILQNNIDCKH
ncbi:unnamed protein product [Ranitomeya imitator]|uniref:Uncharacterized protein n=1 Tax=Ranitomeya imitator TaxID=111125 RepID=A0ABN9L3J9_9NEOB|nr:unnamed protein product [Ranitomeya imitator]